jgi:uncharacterized membrane protein
MKQTAQATEGQQTKRQKALDYMREYVKDAQDQVIDEDWLTDLSFDGLGYTLTAMIVIFGSVEEVMKFSGTNLSHLINQIKN